MRIFFNVVAFNLGVCLLIVLVVFLAKIVAKLNALLRSLEDFKKALLPSPKALETERQESAEGIQVLPLPLTEESVSMKSPPPLPLREDVSLSDSPPPLPLREDASLADTPPPLPSRDELAAAATPPPLPLREDASLADTPPTLPLEPAEPVAVPVPPKTSLLASRLQILKNWFLYGQLEAPKISGRTAEKLLAATWLLRAGILVILFTAAFMLKLSIERGLLAPEGRVILSYLCGAVLLLFGLRLQKGVYRRLGQAILGIALVLFYFSTFALSAMYHLAPAFVAATLMLLTTFAAGFIAHRFNALAVAIIAILGGYGTPIMLNTGAKNFPGLFAYMVLLGIGVLWLAVKRNWLPLNWLGMLFCYALYHLACSRHFSPGDFSILLSALIVFFILYSTVVFVHNVRHRLPATVLEVCALLANAGIFFVSCGSLIGRMTPERLWLAPLTVGLTLFYMGHAYLFMSKRLRDKGLVLSFLGLAAFFLALTFPVVFSTRWLGAAWALQALLMLWLGYSMNSRFLRGAAWLLFVFCLERFAFHDLGQAFSYGARTYSSNSLSFWREFTERIIQFVVPVACLAAAARLCRRPPEEGRLAVPEGSDIQKRTLPFSLPISLLTSGGILLFIYLNFEVYRTIGFCYWPFRKAAMTGLWVLGATAMLPLLLADGRRLWRFFFQGLLVGILIKTFFIDFLPCQPNLRFLYHTSEFLWRDSAMRILDFGFLVLGFFAFSQFFRDKEKKMGRLCGFLWPLLLFIYSTWELNTVLANRLPGLMGGGISVLWGSFAFCFVYQGLKKNLCWLRYLGLSLFLLVVGKVFFYDLSKLDASYRVLAFLLFGLLLMGAAFIYLKFWKSDAENDEASPLQ
ncbi:MAG: DUF2339 domain-containing protein [Lentisphaeria bacterium]